MLKRIFCVDDNDDHRELLQIFFEEAGYQFQSCKTAVEFLEMPNCAQSSAVILDSILQFSDGEEIFDKIRAVCPQAKLIFFTGDAREKSRLRAFELGADGYLVKPNDLINIVEIIKTIISS